MGSCCCFHHRVHEGRISQNNTVEPLLVNQSFDTYDMCIVKENEKMACERSSRSKKKMKPYWLPPRFNDIQWSSSPFCPEDQGTSKKIQYPLPPMKFTNHNPRVINRHEHDFGHKITDM